MSPILHMRKLSPKKPSHLPTDTELVNGRARYLTNRDRQNSLSDRYFSSINTNVGSNREDMEASEFQEYKLVASGPILAYACFVC